MSYIRTAEINHILKELSRQHEETLYLEFQAWTECLHLHSILDEDITDLRINHRETYFEESDDLDPWLRQFYGL
jgi:hypothetical protein